MPHELKVSSDQETMLNSWRCVSGWEEWVKERIGGRLSESRLRSRSRSEFGRPAASWASWRKLFIRRIGRAWFVG